MTVVSFYFWMIKAKEKICSRSHVSHFFKIINDHTSWLELNDLKFAISCKTKL